MGSIFIDVVWTGSIVPAPDGYPGGPDVDESNPIPIGRLGRPADAIPIQYKKYADVSGFLTDPAVAATYCAPFNTATIPNPITPNWISTALGTGFIDSVLSGGFRVNIASATASFVAQ